MGTEKELFSLKEKTLHISVYIKVNITYQINRNIKISRDLKKKLLSNGEKTFRYYIGNCYFAK